MAVEVPSVIDDVDTPAFVQRRATQALTWGNLGAFAGGIGALNGWAHGICHPGHLKVTQTSTPSMGVSVAAGLAFITGTVSAEQGPYVFTNNAAVTRTIAPADATNPRSDLVIAQIVDPQYSGSSPSYGVVVVTGTPAPTPSDPSLAAYPNALVLARVAVAANATSITNANLTDLRTMGGPLAGMPWCQVGTAGGTSFSVPDAELFAVPFSTETYDPHNWFNPAQNTRIVPKIAGWYRVTTHFNFANGSAWLRIEVQARKNGSVLIWSDEQAPHSGTIGATATSSGQLIWCNGTTDYIEMQIFQDNTSNASRLADAAMLVELVAATPA